MIKSLQAIWGDFGNKASELMEFIRSKMGKNEL